LAEGSVPAIESFVAWAGSGDDIDLSVLDAAIAPFRQRLVQIEVGEVKIDTEVFEGELAAVVHASLCQVPAVVLDDRGFWRYLALSRFWWYIAWREAKPLAAGNGDTYTDARLPVMAIPSRLFLRGQAVVKDGDYALTSTLPRSTDFWRSHVLRVRVGSSPALSRAFVGLQRDVGMKTDDLRVYARKLNRSWSNVVLHLYDEDEARVLLDELHASSTPAPDDGGTASEQQS
jgi:hypothetical protein